MKLSVVILNWNGRGFLEKFLPMVCRDSVNEYSEVIVADNGSTDDSVAFLKAEYPNVRLLVFDKNYGFAGGYNKAIELLDSEYVLLLNSDVETTPGYVDTMYSYMEQHEEVAACQPKILAYYNKQIFEYAGGCGGYIDHLGYPFCKGRIMNTLEEDRGQYDEVSPIFWSVGAALFIRRSVYIEVGGLDERFFAHEEEIDLCWRLNSRGYKLVCLPKSVVYHVGGGALPVGNPRKTFLNFRNNLIMIYKNKKDICWVMFIRFFMDYMAAIVFLLKLQGGNFLAVFKARVAYWRSRHLYKEDRKRNLESTKVQKIGGVLNSSIVFDYYVRGIKKFSDLKF